MFYAYVKTRARIYYSRGTNILQQNKIGASSSSSSGLSTFSIFCTFCHDYSKRKRITNVCLLVKKSIWYECLFTKRVISSNTRDSIHVHFERWHNWTMFRFAVALLSLFPILLLVVGACKYIHFRNFTCLLTFYFLIKHTFWITGWNYIYVVYLHSFIYVVYIYEILASHIVSGVWDSLTQITHILFCYFIF